MSVVVHLGAVEWEDEDQAQRPRAVGGRGIAPAPDVPRLSNREFGHRVGAARLAGQLDEHGIVPAVVVDVLTAERYPGLLEHLPSSEYLAGGLSASRPITSDMSEDEEADYIGLTLERLEAALGHRPAGWCSPERSESARTPGLLAVAGVSYLTDWVNDDMPYSFADTAPGLWSFPLSWELSDEATGFHRAMEPATWARSVGAALEQMAGEGGRVLGLSLTPWVSGQAFRAPAVDTVLGFISAMENIWVAPPGAVIEYCRGEAR